MDGLAFVQMVEAELKRRGISKEKFYKESGISSATMSQWRKRVYSPSSAAIKKIEDYLGIVFSIEQKEKEQPTEQYGELSESKLKLIKRLEDLSEDSIYILSLLAESLE